MLISIDSLRRDGLGCFGNARGPSPFIDALARRGIRFSGAVSTTTWTMPAHHALLRGLPDDVHGYLADARPPATIGGRALPEILREEAGYQTFGVYSGPYLHETFGFAEGFDTYESAVFYPVAYDAKDTLSPGDWQEAVEATHAQSHVEITSDEVLARCIGFLKKRDPARPLFLFAHFFDVHFEYTPPPDFARFSRGLESSIKGVPLLDPRIHAGISDEDKRYLRALYDDEILWVDHNVGKLLNTLRRESRERDTIVVIVSDHGEEFFEHGEKTHRRNLYQETLAIPLVLASFKGTLPADIEIEARVRIYDVAPTLLELAGLSPPGWMLGESLLALVRDAERAQPRDAPAELQYEGNHRALLHAGMKLIGVKEHGAEKPRFELYDLEHDPGETQDLMASGDPEAIGIAYNESLEELAAGELGVPRQPLRGKGPIPDLRKHLRDLGYADPPSEPTPLHEMVFRRER
ncbi:MAG: sulfatase [Planctomycetota bacterium]